MLKIEIDDKTGKSNILCEGPPLGLLAELTMAIGLIYANIRQAAPPYRCHRIPVFSY